MAFHYLNDPKDGKPSVSLTLLMVSFLGVLVAASLQLAKVTDSTSVMTEVFYSTLALYFGRRFTVGSKTFTADQASQVEAEVEKLNP